MSIQQSYPLLSNVAVTGNPFKVGGGFYAFAVLGTFGGATVKLQILGPDATTYMDIDSSIALTAAGVQGVDLPAGATVKAVVTGGAPSGLYASLSLARQ